MKKKKYTLILLLHFLFFNSVFSQVKLSSDTGFFNYAYWHGVAEKKHYNQDETAELISAQKALYLEELNHDHVNPDSLIWIMDTAATQAAAQLMGFPSSGKYGTANTFSNDCNNIDFENNSTAGWTVTAGFNPGFSGIGCCPNTTTLDATIMAGAGTDANCTSAGFPPQTLPVVYPGPTGYPSGGNFSLRIGSTATGGRADRIAQTITVTANNAFFTYHYAVVLNDGGHTAAQQPYFTSEVVNATTGAPLACTSFSAAAGAAATANGFLLSTKRWPNNTGTAIYFKPWTTNVVDLTPFIGQAVTLRFTVYDCSPSGHWAYAYIDGACASFTTFASDTVCPGVPVAMCASPGFSTYTWNGPGIANVTTSCITSSVAGTYTCATILPSGCAGPTFTHEIINSPVPAITFTPNSGGICTPNFTLNSTIGIPAGPAPTPASVSSFTWNFGDGSGLNTTQLNPAHSYANAGTYSVILSATSNSGCVNRDTVLVTVFPTPTLAFSPPAYCVTTPVQFSNTSVSAPTNSITNYFWDFGDGGATSGFFEPTHTYMTNGVYNVVLTATTSNGCTLTITNPLSILPAPVISFSAANLCDKNGTNFVPTTTAGIATGSLIGYLWDFGDPASGAANTSTLATPTHSYTGPGNYVITYTVESDHHCITTGFGGFSINPSPTVALTTTSINACTPTFTFNNSMTILGDVIQSYDWLMGDGNSTLNITAPIPPPTLTHTFSSIGTYSVRLIARSSLGCEDTALQVLNIFQMPIIGLNVPSSCESAAFTASTQPLSGTVTSYSWDFGDIASGTANTSTLQNPTHAYTSAGLYTLSLNIMSNQDCPATSTIALTIYPNPVADFTFATLNNCSLPYTFTNNSTVSNAIVAGNTFTNYLWNFSGTLTSVQNPTFTFPEPGTYSVSLISITNNNCRDTTGITTITVHPMPQLSFSVESVCLGEMVNITASSSISPVPVIGNSIASYTWNYGDGSPISTFQNPPAHTYTTYGTYGITFSATSNMGCVASIVDSVAIYAVPSLSFATNPNVCLGNAAVFSNTVTIDQGFILTSQLNYGDGFFNAVNPNSSSSYTYPTTGSFVITFSAISEFECKASAVTTINIRPIPTTSFTTNGGCLNVVSNFADNTTFTVAAATNTIATWNWNFGDGSAANSAQNPSHTYTTHGTYTPTLTTTSSYGCVNSISNTLTIYPLPFISIAPPDACIGTNILFANSPTLAIGTYSTFAWDFADGSQTITTTPSVPTHSYATDGSYDVTVTVTSDQNCVTTVTDNLVIFPFPQATITPIGDICINTQAAINTNTIITSGSISSYTLNFGDAVQTVTNSLASIVPHLYTAYGTFTVSLNAVSNQGCARTFSNTVSVYPNPFPNFSATDFCLNQTTAFTNTSTISSPATYSITSYQWNFGDASGTSTVISPTHSYTNAGTYSVQLTAYSVVNASLTCADNTVIPITINPLPALAFASNSVCAGSSTSFTNNTTGGSTYAWDFENTGTTNSTLQNPTHIYPAAGTYTAELKSETSLGCSDSILSTVVVYANPTASFSANNVCYSLTTNFTNLSVSNIPNPLMTYTWNLSNGLGVTTVSNPAYTYTAANTYTVQLITTNNFGCTDAFDTAIVVYPLPVVSFNPPDVCVNTPISITSNTSIASGSIDTWNWNFGDGSPTSPLVTPTHTYTNPITHTITLIATSDQFCSATFTADIDIYPYPQATLAAVGDICVNSQAAISTNTVITSGSISNYTLNFGDGVQTLTNSITFTVPHVYTSYATFTISLNAISNQGCARTFTNTIAVYPKPFPDFLASNLCEKQITAFTNTSTIPSSTTLPGYSITSYLWDFGDATATSTLTSPTHSYATANTFAVQLTAYSVINPTLTCSASTLVPVTINPLPLPAFASSSVCAGFATSFTNNTTGGSTYAWDFENTGSTNSALQSPTYIYPAAGTYTAELIAQTALGCRDSISKTVVVYANPTSSFVVNNVCFNALSSFTNQSVPNMTNAAMSYTWNLGSGQPSNTTDPTITYPSPIIYTVQLTAENAHGCKNVFTNTTSVYPLPTLSINPPNVCVGTPITFSNTTNMSIASGSITNVAWNFGDGTPVSTSTLFAPVYTYTTPNPPNTSYTINLAATSNQGCVQTATHAVTIYPYASATVTPLQANQCINAPTGVNVNLVMTSGTVSHTLNFGDGTSITPTGSLVYTAPHTYTAYSSFTISLNTVTDHNCARTFSNIINIYPKPFPNFSASNVCLGDTTFFTATSPTIGLNISTRVWDYGEFGTPQDINPTIPRHRYLTSGTFTVTLSEQNYINPSLSCFADVSKTVVINPKPFVAFTSNTACFGNATTFTNNSTGAVTYYWDLYNNGGLISSLPQPVYTYSAAGTYSVKLTGESILGCQKDTVLPVTVLAKPTASFTASEACLNNQTAFTDQSTLGMGSVLHYTWLVQPSVTYTAQNPFHTYPSAGEHTVFLTVQNSGGCRDAFSSTVLVNPAPAVHFTASPACLNKPVNFTNMSSVETGSIVTWNWDFDNDNAWDDHSAFPLHIYPTSGMYLAILEAETNKGCKARETNTVIVYENPTADFGFPPRPCLNNAVQFTNLSTSPTGSIVAYFWDYTNDGFVDNTTANPKNTYTLSGLVSTKLQVVTNYQCESVITKTLYINPTPKVIMSSDRTDGCPPLCVKFSSQNSTIPTGSIVSATWDFGDGDVPANGYTPVHCFNQGAFDIALTLTSDSGCTATNTSKNFISVYGLPTAGFNVIPDEIDEDQPNISVISNASDAASVRYFVSDGTAFYTDNFNHAIKDLDIRTNPMIVQIVRSQYGCTDTTFKVLKLKPSFNVYVPDAFTPNGDGLNDVFLVKGVGIHSFAMRVFDRWGHVVFETNDINQGWDGHPKGSNDPIKQDVYIWKAQVKDIFGKTHNLDGHVTVLPDSGF